MEEFCTIRMCECRIHKLVFIAALLASLVFFVTVCVVAQFLVFLLQASRNGEGAGSVPGMGEHNTKTEAVTTNYPLALFSPEGDEVLHSEADVSADASKGTVIYAEKLESILIASSQGFRIDLAQVATPCRFRFISCSALIRDDLLHIEEMQDLPATEYAAISHVWASASPKDGILTGRGSFLVECEERNDGGPISIDVLHHTCQAALQEGVEFIWLDRLCILQTLRQGENVSVDKKWQIMRMHEIYQQSRVTLVLIAGLRRFPHRFEATGWVDRAWTFQEAMVAPEAKVLFVDYSASAGSPTPPVLILPIETYFVMQPSQSDDDAVALERQQQFIDALRDRARFRSNGLSDVLSRYHTIWRFVQWRSSARQADVVFSVMAMLGVSLDPSNFEKNDRFEATLALVQEMLRNDPAQDTFVKIPLWSVIDKLLVEEVCKKRGLPILNVHDYMMRLPSIIHDIRQLQDVLDPMPIHDFYGTTTRSMPARAEQELKYDGSMIPPGTVNQLLNEGLGEHQHIPIMTNQRVVIGLCRRLSLLAGPDTHNCMFGWCIQDTLWVQMTERPTSDMASRKRRRMVPIPIITFWKFSLPGSPVC